uniref:HhH-GPD domain-containing protein n=1 Tax=Oryza meridionalis TaxID=40149 RepID=A0A0E0EP94_9ORYZ
MAAAEEAILQKRKKQAEEMLAPLPFPHLTAAEETPPNPETPILGEAVAVAVRRKERKRKKEEAAGVGKKEKKRKSREGPPAPEARRKERKRMLMPRQSPHDQIHSIQVQANPPPLGGGRDEAYCRGSCKKIRVLSNREIIKMRIQLRKHQPLPQGIFDPETIMASNSNSIQQDPNHSSPFGAFFDQFCYKPTRQDRTPPLPRTPDLLVRPTPQDHLSSASSQLMTNHTCKINSTCKTTTFKTRSGPNQGNTKVKEMARVNKERKPAPLLSRAEKRSDKYRRLPLDQLVPPPRSPHKLLQEKYASDPWKVIVICMLLNLTQGKQVRRKVKGFFKRYPDAQTAFSADPEKMAKYLAPLGLQRVKVNRIQRFSRAYVEEEWTYITELCGVGKYAADAYAIFCAGRATEVVPADHKLVDYWKYVCFELPMIQQSQDMQEAGVTEMEHAVPKVEELAVCC